MSGRCIGLEAGGPGEGRWMTEWNGGERPFRCYQRSIDGPTTDGEYPAFTEEMHGVLYASSQPDRTVI